MNRLKGRRGKVLIQSGEIEKKRQWVSAQHPKFCYGGRDSPESNLEKE